MKALSLHSWDLTYSQARDLQTVLATKVTHIPFNKQPPIIVAGLDCAFTAPENRFYKLPPGHVNQCIAVIVVMQIPSFEVIETAHALVPVTFPYIPGLLTFREAPACIEAAKKIKSDPDLIIVDGQGIAHPRRLGIAAHLGLIFDRPTIGCAKSRLIGEHKNLSAKKGSSVPLTDQGQVIGAVLRTRTNVKPVYVSVGNKMTLDDAIRLTLACTTTFRLPEPSRLAHQLVTSLKKSAPSP